MATYGDVGDVMGELFKADDKAGAAEFMDTYRKFNPEGADSNVGYICGYFGDMAAMLAFFQTSHPIFGTTTPTHDEAFEAGKQLGEKAKAEA